MTQSYYNDPRNESVIVHVITPPDNKSMTNGVIRAVVITSKYTVQSSPREKRNTKGEKPKPKIVTAKAMSNQSTVHPPQSNGTGSCFTRWQQWLPKKKKWR